MLGVWITLTFGEKVKSKNLKVKKVNALIFTNRRL
jgi:hypothetical protein